MNDRDSITLAITLGKYSLKDSSNIKITSCTAPLRAHSSHAKTNFSVGSEHFKAEPQRVNA